MKKPAEKTDRIIHFIVDSLLITLITIFIAVIISFIFVPELDIQPDYFQTEPLRSQYQLIYLFVFFAYYILFEGSLGKTPGKMVTRSFVWRKDGLKPHWWQVFLRTLLRITGIDIISFLFGVQVGLHDTLSRTVVVKETDKN